MIQEQWKWRYNRCQELLTFIKSHVEDDHIVKILPDKYLKELVEHMTYLSETDASLVIDFLKL